uniref:Uncharacterized protein n=1 Tax=Zea mays TaxID=4577 RepID=C0PBL6_MAIZE|nr:unknown [Zea mays]
MAKSADQNSHPSFFSPGPLITPPVSTNHVYNLHHRQLNLTHRSSKRTENRDDDQKKRTIHSASAIALALLRLTVPASAPSSATARLAAGVARKVGQSSPAMMTTTCSRTPAAGLAAPVAEPFSPSAPAPAPPASPAARWSRPASRYPDSFQ